MTNYIKQADGQWRARNPHSVGSDAEAFAEFARNNPSIPSATAESLPGGTVRQGEVVEKCWDGEAWSLCGFGDNCMNDKMLAVLLTEEQGDDTVKIEVEPSPFQEMVRCFIRTWHLSGKWEDFIKTYPDAIKIITEDRDISVNCYHVVCPNCEQNIDVIPSDTYIKNKKSK